MRSILLFILTMLLVTITGKSQVRFTDKVFSSFVYTQNDTNYIILHESVYKPENESYDQGLLSGSGSGESKICVYNGHTGKLVTRRNMGNNDSLEVCHVMGISNNILWIYWMKYGSAIQGLNPVTLEREVTMANIYSKTRPAVGTISGIYWRSLAGHFTVEPIDSKIIVTNNQGEKHYIDTRSYVSKPVTEKINMEPANYYLNPTIKADSFDLGFTNGNECNITVRGTLGDIVQKKPLKFINPQFIVELNREKLYNYYSIIKFDLLWKGDLNKAEEKLLDETDRNIKALKTGYNADKMPMQPQNGSVLIYHKSDDSDLAVVAITQLSIDTAGQISHDWTVQMPGMFYNIYKSRQSDTFKKIFGQIEPDPYYRYISLTNNKLYVIYLLHVICIDTRTGKIIWRLKL